MSAAEASESVYMRERVNQNWTILIGQVNPFPHWDTFVASSFFKTIWQKEKLLRTSNFSFCHNVSTLFSYRDFLYFGLNVYKVICCRFVVYGEGITVYLIYFKFWVTPFNKSENIFTFIASWKWSMIWQRVENNVLKEQNVINFS